MRTFLITKMVCAKCGSNLQLTYDMPKGAAEYADGEPAGAAMVEQFVVVEPCKKCLAPMEEMRKAARALLYIRSD